MKLIACKNNSIVMKMSRINWLSIGIKAGWIKTATIGYISFQEYINRLLEIGWKIDQSRRSSHIFILAPNRKNAVSFSKNNWDANWIKQKQDLRRISRNLDFVWKTPFVIPDGFDPITFEIKNNVSPKESTTNFMNLSKIPYENIEVLHNDEFKKISEIDFGNFQIMFENGEISQYKPNSLLTIKSN